MIDVDTELNEIDAAETAKARREALQWEVHELLCAEVRAARQRGESLDLWPALPSTVGMP